MATFQVPQFIDQKPKIVGPLTLQQFAFVGSAALLSFIFYYTFDTFLWIFFSIVLGSIALLLAFGKVNGQEATIVLKSLFKFLLEPRLFLWEKNFSEKKKEESAESIASVRNTMSIQQKLKSITMNITTGKAFSPKISQETQKKEGFQVATFSTGEKKFVKKVDYSE